MLDRLREIVGAHGYYDRQEDLEPFLIDHRGLYRGATPLVLRPDDTAQVRAIMRLCNEHGIGVVPVGGNTGYCGAATPSADGSQIVLSMSRMRRIRSLDPQNGILIAEAGCVLADVQAAAASVDRLFPLSLGSEGSCQLGGNLSTNAGGTAVLRYGMMRDLVLGLEVVLPDGRLLEELAPLRKNNTGYDLRDLFIGAEGTLGVITAATCKLYARPAGHFTALVAVADPQAAVELLSKLRSTSGDAVSTFELMPRIALELVCRHIPPLTDPFAQAYPWYVLLEIGIHWRDPEVRAAIDTELLAVLDAAAPLDTVVAANETQREIFWRIRESIPAAQRREGVSIKHDISVPTSELPRFITEASERITRIAPEGRIVAYGHLGDGNLHFNVSGPGGNADDDLLRHAADIQRSVHDLIAAYAGSFSAEHGIGQLKRDELLRYKNPVAVELMRSLKRTLDPGRIMNPGKILQDC
ncbi:FAD-binding oxidoreductase [Steroidobacter denitrificans]|nr:FAD-binding oxidoreductase [Steroidobacter denitrificans]